jgi:hypothetical protein
MPRKKKDDAEGASTPVVAPRPTPPVPAAVAAEPDESVASPDLDNYLRAQNIVEAINRNLPDGYPGLPPIPADYVFKRFDREVTTLALHAAFQLRGGVPALVRWADSDPKSFYNIWSKLVPTEQAIAQANTTIVVQSAVPANALDSVSINETGHVVTVDAVVRQTEEELPE